MHERNLPTRLVLPLALAAALLFPALALAAGDGMSELKTAIKHAGYSAQANTLKKHQIHLQHVVNCLVGEQGEGFNDTVGNPCKGMGQGAIKDLQAGEPVTLMLKQAAELARIGTQIEVAGADKKVAQAVVALLQEAEEKNTAK